MIEIVTGSRLHFGLFQVGETPPGTRRFGGVGMMIDRPGMTIRAKLAANWKVDGERWADRVSSLLPGPGQVRDEMPLHFAVESAAPEHSGLGTGTQLALAVMKARAIYADNPSTDIVTLAAAAGRGRRSGIGAHGFAQGGLLVDGGRGSIDHLAPLVARMNFPDEWRVVVAIPPGDQGWYGKREHGAFDRLATTDAVAADRLCRLTLLGLLPALAERDLGAFGEALYELNVLAGVPFASEQGGLHAGPAVSAVVELLRGLGVKGVGQSSWGPAVFAVVDGEDRAAFITSRLLNAMPLECENVFVSKALNEGARVIDRRSGPR